MLNENGREAHDLLLPTYLDGSMRLPKNDVMISMAVQNMSRTNATGPPTSPRDLKLMVRGRGQWVRD